MKLGYKRCVLAALLVLLLSACSGIVATPIAKILQNPRDYAGKEVKVTGVVVAGDSYIFFKYFLIQDKTGRICVVTSKPLPNVNQKISVKGTVQEAFSFGKERMIVLVEKSDASGAAPQGSSYTPPSDSSDDSSDWADDLSDAMELGEALGGD